LHASGRSYRRAGFCQDLVMRWFLFMCAAFLAGGCSDSSDDLSESAEVVEIPFRVLAEDLPEGDVYSTDIVSSPNGLDSFETAADRSAWDVDFAKEVILVFNIPESGSCALKPIVGVRYDRTTNLVFPAVPRDGGPACSMDAGRHRFIVAVDRAGLPEQDFQLWIGSPAGPPKNATVPVVDVDTMTIRPERISLVLIGFAAVIVGSVAVLSVRRRSSR